MGGGDDTVRVRQFHRYSCAGADAAVGFSGRGRRQRTSPAGARNGEAAQEGSRESALHGIPQDQPRSLEESLRRTRPAAVALFTETRAARGRPTWLWRRSRDALNSVA